MRFVPPLNPTTGELDAALLPYVNGNPTTGIEGSFPGHEAITETMSELVHLVEYSGQTPSSGDLQQVRKAVEAILAQYPTIAQILTYNRVFPHTMTGDNKLTVIDNEDGTATLAADQSWVHRGFFPRSSNDLDVEARTVEIPPNATGHLRWRWNGGAPQVTFGNLADDQGYNPGELVDADPVFDTSLDDMLIARIERDGSGTLEITGLRNRAQLRSHFRGQEVFTNVSAGSSPLKMGEAVTLDWARTPRNIIIPSGTSGPGIAGNMDVGVASSGIPNIESRYGFQVSLNVFNPTSSTWSSVTAVYDVHSEA